VHRLKDAYRGERAAVILGGPSMIDQAFAFDRLRTKNLVVFLESKALTPHFLASGLRPDFLLMLFPEKCSNNGFHNFVFRAFLAGYDLDPLVKPEFLPVVREMRARFNDYFEQGNAARGPHKRFRWRPDVHLPDSPYELLAGLPDTKVLANGALLDRYFPGFRHPNARYLFEQPAISAPFDRDAYYDVQDRDGRVVVGNFGFYNSAAIALYPLLRYMGFRTAYFLGMDMSMLGTMEYGAPSTFKSMLHYRWFFRRTRHVFNAAYRQNSPWYIRPRSEFSDLEALIDPERIDLVRVYSPYKYTVPIPFMKTVSEADFWSN
jgi:hypothetical protein